MNFTGHTERQICISSPDPVSGGVPMLHLSCPIHHYQWHHVQNRSEVSTNVTYGMGLLVSQTCCVPGIMLVVAYFEGAHRLLGNNGQRCKKNYSCLGSCKERESTNPPRCGCDQSCLYLGNCCFDFLYQCGNYSELNHAIQVQAKYRQRFKDNVKCSTIDIFISKRDGVFEHRFGEIPLIGRCPEEADSSISKRCESRNIFLFYPRILVHHMGVLYANSFCAVCNGVGIEKMNAIGREIIKVDATYSSYSAAETYRFVNRFPERIVSLYSTYGDFCINQCHFGDDICLDSTFSEECAAYQARYVYSAFPGKPHIYKNEACFQCSANYTDISPSCENGASCYSAPPLSSFENQWTTLFDFTGRMEGYFENKHTLGTDDLPSCNELMCQSGYVLIKTECPHCAEKAYRNPGVTFTSARNCILFLIFRSQKSFENFKRHYESIDMIPNTNCSNLVGDLENVMPVLDQLGEAACAVFSIPFVGIRDYIDALSSPEILNQITSEIPSPIQTAFLINFDPDIRISCEGTLTSTKVRTVELKNGLELFLQDDDQIPFANNHTPIVLEIPLTVPQEEIKPWKISCIANMKEFNCESPKIAGINFCPKIQVPVVMDAASNTVSINSHMLYTSEYILTSSNTALICQENCRVIRSQWHVGIVPLAIFTPVCYTFSMLGLLMTFVIYLRIPSLRTIPALMVMNLTLALLLAQLSYLVSSFGVLLDKPGWCHMLAATQHYFWLTSFAWMACISFDIFLCLRRVEPLNSISHRTRYYKIVSGCWFVPMLLPVATVCLQMLGITYIGYGGKSACWLLNASSVLYLFVVPVLSIVLFNSVTFLACVYTIREISMNASYAGRNVDGKERLVLSLKISSLMGISWLFGILPNVVDRPELWYIFVVCNAFQGVHIFLAFGLSRRARQLICGNKPATSEAAAATATTQ